MVRLNRVYRKWYVQMSRMLQFDASNVHTYCFRKGKKTYGDIQTESEWMKKKTASKQERKKDRLVGEIDQTGFCRMFSFLSKHSFVFALQRNPIRNW